MHSFENSEICSTHRLGSDLNVLPGLSCNILEKSWQRNLTERERNEILGVASCISLLPGFAFCS